MTISDYVSELRGVVGHRMLFLPGVNAVVLDDAGRVLLARRVCDGIWSTVGGISEPGEQPAETAVREVFEETAVWCVPERIVSVVTLPQVTYPSGDVCQFMTISMLCRAVGGEARVNDAESHEVGWFSLDELPPMKDLVHERIRLATAADPAPAWFMPAGPPDEPSAQM